MEILNQWRILKLGIMICSKCGTNLSGDEKESKITCDCCKSQFCKSCSKLSSTELRCMQLVGKRILRFFCESCNDLMQFSQQVMKRMNDMEMSFNSELHALRKFTEDLNTTLSQKVTSLCESNKDVVQLIRSSLDPTETIAIMQTPTEGRRQVENCVDDYAAAIMRAPSEGRKQVENCVDDCAAGETLLKPGEQIKAITEKDVATAVSKAQVQRKCKEVIALGGDLNASSLDKPAEKDSKYDWQMKTDKRKRRRSHDVVVGTGGNETDPLGSIRGVPRKVDLHVYRLAPGTKADSLRDRLRPHFPEVICRELSSRSPEEYSSFKVSISEKNFRTAMEPSLWPLNTCVRRFFYPRKGRSTTT